MPYFAQAAARRGTSGGAGAGSVSSFAGSPASVNRPTKPPPGVAKTSMLEGAAPVQRMPCGRLRGRKM